jgi:RNA helicase HrpA
VRAGDKATRKSLSACGEIVLLPIDAERQRIVDTVSNNQVTIVVGETGSGKTTRLPVFLHENGLGGTKKIGVTEPRRLAATSVARYVSEEIGSKLGNEVGYQVRFDDETSSGTKIKFMTDGILLREIQADPDLKQYSVIMVDEAHERSVNIDFILGLLKDLLKRRADLKVVVASATIDSEKFSKYFDGAPVVLVSGRTFDVSIRWGEDIRESDLPKKVAEKIENIHTKEPEGDILVFMTGMDDIDRVIEEIEDKYEDLVVLPAHGGLAPEDQYKIFNRFPGKRKVVVATNIAETSLTIDGIVYVIDSGLVKQTSFNSETGIQSLSPVSHSKAGCNQRAGRAGRTRPGICYRMFSEASFNFRQDYTEPEIRRLSLAGVVLSMESIGITEVEKFEFVDQPDKAAFHEAYETLIALGAIKSDRKGLTDLGVRIASLPLEPRMARMVLEAEKYGCVKEIATIAAFMSLRSVFSRPKGKEDDADYKHMRFKDNSSDAMTYLRVWREYEENKFSRSWCFDNFLNCKGLDEVRNIRSQLFSVLKNGGIVIISANNDEAILRSVAAGLVQNLMEHGSRHAYDGIMRDSLYSVFVHPGSAVFGLRNPRWIVCTEIVNTRKTFARGVSTVDPEWLPSLVPNIFSYGKTTLAKLSEDGKTVVARREVIKKSVFGQNVVANVEVKISIDAAKKIQDENLRQAKLEGLIPLSFKKEMDNSSYYGFEKWVARTGMSLYHLGWDRDIEPIEGVTYYCKTGQEGAIFNYRLTASPKFAFLDGLILQDKASEEIQPTESLADKLSKAWGAKVTSR